MSFEHFSTHGCCGWKGKHIDKGALATCTPFLVPAICTLAQPTCWRAEKLKPLANPLDMFGLLNLQRLQVCKHMPRPLRKELELDLSQAGFRTLPNFAFPEWQFSNPLEFFILSMISTLLGRKVLDFLQKSFGGGTYLEDALAEVATKLQQEIWQNAVAQLHPTWYPVSLMI